MKNIIAIIILFGTLSFKLITPTQYPTPAEKNTPYYYDEKTNSLTSLETVKFTKERVRKGMWGKEDLLILPAPSSTVTIKKSKATKFVISYDGTASELYTNCILNTTEVNEKLKRREWVYATKGAHGIQEQHDDVLMKFESIGSNLYLITLEKKLGSGELFFQVSKSETVFAFNYK